MSTPISLFLCLLGEFIHELTGVPHYVIEGAGHVPYILNQGSDFVAAIDMGERVGRMPSHASKLAACLEQQHEKWAEFICLPSPHLSGTLPSLYSRIYISHLLLTNDNCFYVRTIVFHMGQIEPWILCTKPFVKSAMSAREVTIRKNHKNGGFWGPKKLPP